jgi:hypothetical protein
MAIQENPYLPPASRVEDAEVVRGDFIDGGRSVPARHGWDWIAAGWRIFRRQPGTWIVMSLVFGLVLIAMSLVPLLGAVATVVVLPVFVAGFMHACSKIERAEDIALGDLFAAFQKGAGPLFVLGLIEFGLFIAAMIPSLALLAFLIGLGDTGTAIVLFALVYVAALLPVYMAIWFGPPLVALQDMAPTRALGQSFRACLKNIIPFIVYGAVLMVLAVIATLPLFLGWFVLGPVIVASVYAAYRDIYFQE